MRIFLIFFVLLSWNIEISQAEDYPYLTFETTDGVKTSVPAASLSLTISGATLTAGNQTFTITNLSKMYFSKNDETTSGILDVITTDMDEAVAVYDLQGRQLRKDEARKGVFVIKTENGTCKVCVK